MKIYLVMFVFILYLSNQVKAEPAYDADYWLNEYTKLEEDNRSKWDWLTSECIAYGMRDGSTLLWRDALQVLPSYLYMYQWSYDPIYLDRFVERADQIISYSVDIDGDGYVGWPTKGPGTLTGEQWSVDFGVAMSLMRFVNLTENNPVYADSSTRYRGLAETMGVKYNHLWVDLPQEKGMYFNVLGGTIPPQSSPFNLLAVSGMYHFEMGDKDRVNAILHTIEGAFRPHPTKVGVIVWNYRDNILPGDQHVIEVEDTSHAGLVISFLSRAKPELIPTLIETSLSTWDGQEHFWWMLDSTNEIPSDLVPYRDIRPYPYQAELGSSMYEAIKAMWHVEKRNPYFMQCRPGSSMLTPALVLLHNFPRQRTFIPVVFK